VATVNVVTVNRDTRPGVYPILVGMWITFKNMWKALFGGYYTIQYPEQKRTHSARYRGIHILTQRMDGTPKCVACYMCATVCPAECIFIEAGERPTGSSRSTPRASRSTSCAASTAASAWTPARRRPSS